MFSNALFILSSILILVSGILVLVTKEIMHACLYLLGTLIGVAGLYLTLGADFLAAVQIMVYVGGVVILMLFAVMLTGGKEFMERQLKIHPHSDPFMGNRKTYVTGGLAALVLIGTLYGLLTRAGGLGQPDQVQPFESTVERIGLSLLTDHVLAFELSSVLLLGALIGAAIIARPRSE